MLTLLGPNLVNAQSLNLVNARPSPYNLVSGGPTTAYFDYEEAYNASRDQQRNLLLVIGTPTSPADYNQAVNENLILVILPTSEAFPTAGRKYLTAPLPKPATDAGLVWKCVNGICGWYPR